MRFAFSEQKFTICWSNIVLSLGFYWTLSKTIFSTAYKQKYYLSVVSFKIIYTNIDDDSYQFTIIIFFHERFISLQVYKEYSILLLIVKIEHRDVH